MNCIVKSLLVLDLEKYPVEKRRKPKQYLRLLLAAQMLQAVESDNIKDLCSREFWPPVKRLLNHASCFVDKFEREEAHAAAAGYVDANDTTECMLDANSLFFRLTDALLECPEEDAKLLVALARLMAERPDSSSYLRVLLRNELNAAKL